MAKPGPARQANVVALRRGNPGRRPKADLEQGMRLPTVAPDEPNWLDWFPAVRVQSVKKLQEQWPLELIEGSLVHIESDGKREHLAAARQRWLIHNERDTQQRSRREGQRARDVCRHVWRQVVPILDGQQVLTILDETVLVDLCRTVARIDQCERDISERGLWTQGERGAVKNPATTVMNQLRTHLKFLVGELGLSPVARDALNPKGPADDGDDFFD